MIALLRDAGVAQVVDIRRRPRSARHPHFDADTLSAALAEAGLSYRRLGDTLGGHRAEGYEAYMRTESFAHGLVALDELAGEGPRRSCAPSATRGRATAVSSPARSRSAAGAWCTSWRPAAR